MKPLRMLLAAAVCLSLVPSTLASAQGTTMKLADLYQMNGKVIARGSNTNPVGPEGLKTYRIEELSFAPGTRIDVNGTIVEAQTAWRIVILGTSFQVRALPGIISIDETNLLPAQESVDLLELAAITFDRSLIHNNAAIALSYGNQRTELPERVKLSNAR